MHAPPRPVLPRLTETPFLLKLEDLRPQLYDLPGSDVPWGRVETSLRSCLFNSKERLAIVSFIAQTRGDFPFAPLNIISNCRSLQKLSSVILGTYGRMLEREEVFFKLL